MKYVKYIFLLDFQRAHQWHGLHGSGDVSIPGLPYLEHDEHQEEEDASAGDWWSRKRPGSSWTEDQL